MTKIFLIASFLFHVSAPFAYAAAVPAAVPAAVVPTFPEVIPGPGLPSLASLGLTSAGLYQKKVALTSASSLTRRFTDHCGRGQSSTANVDDMIACFNFLEAVQNPCVIPADGHEHVMCSAGTARISGVDLTSQDTTSSCYDVALGVQWVFTNCNTAGQVEGSAATYGNGDLIVVFERDF